MLFCRSNGICLRIDSLDPRKQESDQFSDHPDSYIVVQLGIDRGTRPRLKWAAPAKSWPGQSRGGRVQETVNMYHLYMHTKYTFLMYFFSLKIYMNKFSYLYLFQPEPHRRVWWSVMYQTLCLPGMLTSGAENARVQMQGQVEGILFTREASERKRVCGFVWVCIVFQWRDVFA